MLDMKMKWPTPALFAAAANSRVRSRFTAMYFSAMASVYGTWAMPDTCTTQSYILRSVFFQELSLSDIFFTW